MLEYELPKSMSMDIIDMTKGDDEVMAMAMAWWRKATARHAAAKKDPKRQENSKVGS
jgi:hypothetical protein